MSERYRCSPDNRWSTGEKIEWYLAEAIGCAVIFPLVLVWPSFLAEFDKDVVEMREALPGHNVSDVSEVLSTLSYFVAPFGVGIFFFDPVVGSILYYSAQAGLLASSSIDKMVYRDFIIPK